MGMPSNRLLFSTARIMAFLSSGGQSVGTAFFFNFKLDDTRHVPALVTNKHVVRDASRGEFHLHEAHVTPDGTHGPANRPINVTLDAFAQRWVGHPGDIDLCAMPVAPLYHEVQGKGKAIYSVALDDAACPMDR
ncbi:MAG: hypothetical protein ACRDJN_13175 [Chloroflexota bacterium]